MTRHTQTFGLSLNGFSVRPGTLPRAETAQLLARLQARAGRAEKARRSVEIGLQAIAEELAPHRHAYPTWKLRSSFPSLGLSRSQRSSPSSSVECFGPRAPPTRDWQSASVS